MRFFKAFTLFIFTICSGIVFSADASAQQGQFSVVLKKNGSAATYLDGKLVSTRTTLNLPGNVTLNDGSIIIWPRDPDSPLCKLLPCPSPLPPSPKPCAGLWCPEPPKPWPRPCAGVWCPHPPITCLSCPPGLPDLFDIRKLGESAELKDALKAGRFTVQRINGNVIYRQR